LHSPHAFRTDEPMYRCNPSRPPPVSGFFFLLFVPPKPTLLEVFSSFSSLLSVPHGPILTFLTHWFFEIYSRRKYLAPCTEVPPPLTRQSIALGVGFLDRRGIGRYFQMLPIADLTLFFSPRCDCFLGPQPKSNLPRFRRSPRSISSFLRVTPSSFWQGTEQ